MSTSRRTAQVGTPASYWRGGTSRAIIFNAKDLPTSQTEQKKIFLSALGSPDPNGRQLDGLGSGISSLSKICILSKSTQPADWDVEYTFVAVGIEKAEADWSAMCGNMTSAVGPWAVDHGLLGCVEDGCVRVRILNTNTNKVITSTFDVRNGEYVVDGDFELEGVGGKGAPIQLGFTDPAGAKTGKLLPTGRVRDTLEFPEGVFPNRTVEVSCVDCVNPVVFVSSTNIGLNGTELPNQLHEDMNFRRKMELLRQKGASRMGMVSREEDTPRAVPKVAIVSRPTSYKMLSGDNLDGDKIDLVVRAMSDGMPHRATPLSLALCTAVAAKLEGSVVADLVRQQPVDEAKGITIGHPSGKVVVSCDFDEKGTVREARVVRTARKLFEGNVFWKP